MSEESAVLAALADHPEWSVVEVGGGGSPTPWRTGPYVNVDHTPAGEPGTAGSQKGVISTAHVTGDMASLPFADETFDALVGRHILEHHADTILVLREWRRVLKPHGRLVVVCPDQGAYIHPGTGRPGSTIHMDPTHRAAFTREQLAALVCHAGFTDVSTAEAHPEWSFLLVATRA